MARKHRTFTPEFKFRLVLQILTGQKSAAQLCREEQISDSVLSRWRQQFIDEGARIFEREGTRPDEAAQARIAELERVIGQLTLELAAAKKASEWLDSLP
jgi:transposase